MIRTPRRRHVATVRSSECFDERLMRQVSSAGELSVSSRSTNRLPMNPVAPVMRIAIGADTLGCKTLLSILPFRFQHDDRAYIYSCMRPDVHGLHPSRRFDLRGSSPLLLCLCS